MWTSRSIQSNFVAYSSLKPIACTLYLKMKKFEQLSERQQKELYWALDKTEIKAIKEGKASIQEYVELLKEDFDQGCLMLEEEGPANMGSYMTNLKWQAISISSKSEPHDGPSYQEVQRRAQMYDCVLSCMIKRKVPGTEYPYKDRPHIFRLLETRGNPNFKLKVEANKVRMIAEELMEKNGWKRYRLKRARKDALYSVRLLEDIRGTLAKENIQIGTQAIRQKLKESEYKMPKNCTLV